MAAPRSIGSPARRSTRPNSTDVASSFRPSTSSSVVPPLRWPTPCRTAAGARVAAPDPPVGRPSVSATGSGSGPDLGEVGARGCAANGANVLFVLQDDAETLVDELRGQFPSAERHEGGGP